MDDYDVTAEVFCHAMDAELCRRRMWLNVSAVAEVPRLLARVAVEDILPAVRDATLSPAEMNHLSERSAYRALSLIEKLVKEHT